MMKNKQFLVPDLDVNTRWNSTYLMLKKLCRIREMTDILVASLPELRHLYLTNNDWEQISVSFFLSIILYVNNNLYIYIKFVLKFVFLKENFICIRDIIYTGRIINQKLIRFKAKVIFSL